MSNLLTQVCDAENCKKLRVNDANHWLVTWTKNHVLHIGMMDAADTRGVDGVKHFCGQQCATRWAVMELGKLKG